MSITKVILDVPNDRLGSFLHLVQNLGIQSHSIGSKVNERASKSSVSLQKAKQIVSQYLLFDWEFYSNQLEFE